MTADAIIRLPGLAPHPEGGHYREMFRDSRTIAEPGQPRHALTLGADPMAGQRPQAVVPAHAWQTARALGTWTLVGCTVAPAFQFAGFAMAADVFEPDR